MVLNEPIPTNNSEDIGKRGIAAPATAIAPLAA